MGMTLGVFNIVSSIFLNNTLEAVQRINAQKRRDRLDDKGLFVKNTTALLRMLLSHPASPINFHSSNSLFEYEHELLDMQIQRDIITDISRDEYGAQLLDELDICLDDQRKI